MAGIVKRHRHEQRLRREGVQQVRAIDPVRERRHDVLLRIVGRTGRLDVSMRHVLGVALRHDGDADATVERRQELRQRSAARLSAAADPFGIDFCARQQEVDPADAVPHAEQTEVGAEQNKTASGILVLARSATADRRPAGVCSWVLDALALSKRVVGQDHVTLARQIREQLLIAWPRLAVRRMAEWPEDRRMASSRGRQIEVRGDVESWPAFEGQLLDAIAGSVKGARDARIEGRPLQRSAEHLPDLFGDEFCSVRDSLRRGNRVDRLLAPRARVARESDEVSLEIVRVIRQRGIVDPQIHARGAREAICRCGPSGAPGARRRDDGSGGLEEVAARAVHRVGAVDISSVRSDSRGIAMDINCQSRRCQSARVAKPS